jgi:hypothetical protein
VAPNARAQLTTVTVGGHVLPLTVTAHRRRGSRSIPPSYVVSPFSHYVDYAREELAALGSVPLRRAAGLVIGMLARVLDAGRVDDVVMVGNALVSTNLLPEVTEEQIVDVTARLTRAHPGRAIAWRSVHGRGTELPDGLRRAGYRLIPSRSVLFTPTAADEWMTLSDVKRDRKLFEQSAYAAVEAPIDPETGMSELSTRERIAELYRLLYLDKYSGLNPAYTPAFIGAAQRSGFLRFTLLARRDPPAAGVAAPAGSARDADRLRVDGVLGTTVAHGLLAAPVFGYDTALPPEAGLYRMLSWLAASQAREQGVDLHGSSGVADFKRNRGGEAEIEYAAVFTRHLPLWRRLSWRVLGAVVDVVALPIIRNNEL